MNLLILGKAVYYGGNGDLLWVPPVKGCSAAWASPVITALVGRSIMECTLARYTS